MGTCIIVDHSSGGCECLSSDHTGAYVHGLSLTPRDNLPRLALEDISFSTGRSGAQRSHVSDIGAGRPGSAPFVSHRPGAYGRLLLAVYVRWKMGMLVVPN